MLALLGNTVAGWPFAATAEDRLRVIGVLTGLAEGDPLTTFRVAAFSEGLRQLGWVEGKNIRTERRFSAGVPAKLPELARELIEARCEILLAEAAQAVDAARGATKTVPIVMIYVGDALGPGYIASLSHPGGNITGHTLVATDQAAKRLEYLKKVSPGIMRIAVISNLNASGHIFQRKEMAIAGPALGIELQQLPMKTAEELDATLKAVIDGKAQAIVTMEDPMVQSLRAQITDFGRKNRIPVMGEFRTMAEAGGLISYGPDQAAMWAHSAVYVDKILRGANPGDLPVEQPAKFELVINLKTAQQIDVAIPQDLLVAADEVLE
jgi:putative tryptophan/tyrosine transport system substrate-binding protein